MPSCAVMHSSPVLQSVRVAQVSPMAPASRSVTQRFSQTRQALPLGQSTSALQPVPQVPVETAQNVPVGQPASAALASQLSWQLPGVVPEAPTQVVSEGQSAVARQPGWQV